MHGRIMYIQRIPPPHLQSIYMVWLYIYGIHGRIHGIENIHKVYGIYIYGKGHNIIQYMASLHIYSREEHIYIYIHSQIYIYKVEHAEREGRRRENEFIEA